jgi:hypothetical protein
LFNWKRKAPVEQPTSRTDPERQKSAKQFELAFESDGRVVALKFIGGQIKRVGQLIVEIARDEFFGDRIGEGHGTGIASNDCQGALGEQFCVFGGATDGALTRDKARRHVRR